ncbi:MAG: DUF4445 domain-containing protein, partial [Lachnospiraceae bacterium]|nr:DUF4445 domain-containing protein [Lachnospiraceae bacterium]
MTKREISLCREKQTLKQHCEICTGCGRCRNADAAYCIVTKSPLQREVVEQTGSVDKDVVIVDIGTTTVAMQLIDAGGRVKDTFLKVNPQIIYGTDVLSRILAAEDKAAAEDMRRMISGVLQEGLDRFHLQTADRSRLKMVLAANTTMVYLLRGYDPAKLGKAPFTVEHGEGGLIEFMGIPCYIVPGISAFVGGDIVAGAYAAGMFETDEITLLIDLGTNGELILGNREKRLACSTAAGPAFDGGAGKGIWGADMVSIAATLLKEQIMDETGLLKEPYFEKGICVSGVEVTQQDIRNLQLAKAAVATGISLLTEEYGIRWEKIDRVVLAGGLGYYLK